jgi:hypothetical protein
LTSRLSLIAGCVVQQMRAEGNYTQGEKVKVAASCLVYLFTTPKLQSLITKAGPRGILSLPIDYTPGLSASCPDATGPAKVFTDLTNSQ